MSEDIGVEPKFDITQVIIDEELSSQNRRAGIIVVQNITEALARTPRGGEVSLNKLASAVATNLMTGLRSDRNAQGTSWLRSLGEEVKQMIGDKEPSEIEFRKIVLATRTYKLFKDSWELLKDSQDAQS